MLLFFDVDKRCFEKRSCIEEIEKGHIKTLALIKIQKNEKYNINLYHLFLQPYTESSNGNLSERGLHELSRSNE